MHDCTEYHDLISRLIDSELGSEESEAVLNHIAGCEECAMLYDAYSELSVMVSNCDVDYPTGLHDNIMAEIRRDAIKTAALKENNKAENINRVLKAKSRTGKLISLAACLVAVFTLGRFAVQNNFIPVNALSLPKTASGSSDSVVSEESIQAFSADESFAGAEPAAAEADTSAGETPASFSAQTEMVNSGATVVANVSKIEFFYRDSKVSEFYMHVGDEPLTLSTAITPLSIKSPAVIRSSDPEVLIVTDHGDGTCELIAKNSGTAQVIASYAGFDFSCTVVVVNDGGFSIDVGIYSYGYRVYDITIPLWNSIALSAGYVANLEDVDNNVIWTVEDDSILSIAPYGDRGVSVTGEKVGYTYVFAEIDGLKCKCIVRVFKPEA